MYTMKRTIRLFCWWLMPMIPVFVYGQDIKATIPSPDRRERMEVGVSVMGGLCYRIKVDGKTVVDWSALGLVTEGDNGRGVGASHQTGWTGLIANCLL